MKKIILVTVLVLALAVPAQAWRHGYGGCYVPYRCGPYYGCWGGPAALAAGGVVLLGIGALAIAGANSGSSAGDRMMDSAMNANQYENYLIALQAARRAGVTVFPLPRREWESLRRVLGKEVVR